MSVHVIVGPMFSGKSTELLRRIRRYEAARKKCLVVKYRADDRYSKDSVSTHDRQMLAALPVARLADIPEDRVTEVDVIGIDEGQFFPDLVEWAEAMSAREKTVIVAALDGTFQRKPFGRVLDLIPIAESVVKLNAVCMFCDADAPFTVRLTGETAVELIGGADKYAAACRRCFMKM